MRLVLYTSPVHASLLATLDASGLWPAYEQWQRDLVEHLETYQAGHSTAQISFFDFSHINTITAEPIPAESDAESTMQWYVDPAHFRTEVGELMLATVAGHYETVPDDFSSLPTTSNIEELLAQKRTALYRYLSDNPDMAAFAQDLAQRGLALRAKLDLDCGEALQY